MRAQYNQVLMDWTTQDQVLNAGLALEDNTIFNTRDALYAPPVTTRHRRVSRRNITMGHPAGSQALEQLARAVDGHVPSHGWVGREGCIQTPGSTSTNLNGTPTMWS